MGLSQLSPRKDCSRACDDDSPITGVTWIAAVDFMNALTELENESLADEGKLSLCYSRGSGANIEWDRNCTGYRLPTEVEWEFAVRAATSTAYSFGDLVDNGEGASLCDFVSVDYGWYKVDDYPQCVKNDAAYLYPGCSFLPNNWQLFDMHGNAAEWVYDWYAPYPKTHALGYAGPRHGTSRVLRGGSYRSNPAGLRSAARDSAPPESAAADSYTGHSSDMTSTVGLRCARGASTAR